MGFFGYYAWHSFLNQLRKLFKTWVLVFVIVCMLLGGLIGFGAAMLDETIEAQQDTAEEAAVILPLEEGFSLGIPPESLVELIAGGAILAFFLFEAISADKNGSKIFLPADVNLLFPSPMKPQSVLMFRLATQLGTALIATIYILFQLPNLILNAGLSGWAAGAILVTWFLTIFIGKLVQVLLYTVCSTNPQFKKHMRTGAYLLTAAVLVSFFLYWKSSSLDPLPAADRFFNAPVTRWIPFWGWLKGLTWYISMQNWPLASLCLVLLAAGCVGMVYGIWHIHADFYEDAMAKSEETAAMLEKARSEKTSGTAATRQRKKERKDTLIRDGLNHGWGASVFFHKTMYNRFRFAHFHIFTKTMETYFVAAIGMALASVYFFNLRSELPVVLTLGVFVFFRAMGNPLAEDTGMDFFRLIPVSTWQKLLYSLLGGTANCLLDLLLPMLAACAVIPVNPLKMLIWLPLIVSVDFYAASVVTFIDLSIPASIGKTIKQLITILFIYFGLLPDLGILAFGIALDYTVYAAIISTIVNLALGVLAFSLATVFLQPKGSRISAEVHDQDFKAARRKFSRLGFSVFLMLVLVTILQIISINAVYLFFPQLLENGWAIWLLTFAPQYLIAMPLCILLMRKVPAHRPAQSQLGKINTVKMVFITIFMMYAGNLAGSLITAIVGLFLDSTVSNPLLTYVTGENMTAQVLFMVILAPLFEEYLFRRQLIDRMNVYGGKTAVVLSALLFGLFHGNFSQFFYAFGIGLVFGYVYLKTGRLRYTVIAHMIVNFMGSVLSIVMLQHLPLEALDSGDFSAELLRSPWVVLYGGYVLFLIGSSLAGLALLCMNAGNLSFPAGALELPKRRRFRTACLNTGMLLAFLGCGCMMLLSLVGG